MWSTIVTSTHGHMEFQSSTALWFALGTGYYSAVQTTKERIASL